VKGDHFFGADEASCALGFGRGRHTKFDDLCNDEDMSIVRRDGVIF
jgi:hypothetical protein